jgi:NO-binding membrane sensor protein with MHYT domain
MRTREIPGGYTQMEIHHFQHGWVTPAISYSLSVLGSLLGLVCAIRLRQARTGGSRAWWLALSAIAIGGTGIWTMHFVAMLGFGVTGTPIRYDVTLTAASAVVAVVAVGLGMLTVFGGGGRPPTGVRILTGGVIAGLGVAAMHYMGMTAMHLNGDISYGTRLVAASIAIAVVAATAALWLTATVQKPAAILGAALIMGVAVNGMHFTGMSAVSVHQHATAGTPSGATGTSLLVPIGVTVVFGVLGLLYALMATPTEEDRAAAEFLASRRQATAAVPAPAPAPRFGGAPATGTGSTRTGNTGTGSTRTEAGRDSASRDSAARDSAARDSAKDVPKRANSALNAGSWTYRDRENR